MFFHYVELASEFGSPIVMGIPPSQSTSAITIERSDFLVGKIKGGRGRKKEK